MSNLLFDSNILFDVEHRSPKHEVRRRMVAPGRIELPRPCGHWILSPARLPIPPQGRDKSEVTLIIVNIYRCHPQIFGGAIKAQTRHFVQENFSNYVT